MGRPRDSAPIGALGLIVGILAVVTVVVITAAVVDRADTHRDELIQRSSGKCDAACHAHKRLVAKQMQELRKQIDSDYHSMVTFGDKAGYVPPVRSIRAQVMDGTLLGGDKSDIPAPPPFNPSALVLGGHAHAHGGEKFATSSILPPVEDVSTVEHKMMQEESDKSAASKATSRSISVHHSNAHRVRRAHHSLGGSSLGSIAKPQAGLAKHTSTEVDMFAPSLGSKVSVHGESKPKSKGEMAWEKMFSFMGNKEHTGADVIRAEATSEKGGRRAPNTEPSVVRNAMKKALSFVTSSQPRSKTEKAGDKLLGLHTRLRGRAGAGDEDKDKDPLHSKFLQSWFGEV